MIKKSKVVPFKKPKPFPTKKTPSNLGNLIDKLYDLEQERSKLSAAEKAIKAKIADLEETILKKFSKDALSAAAGTRAKLSVIYKTIPNVKDWDLLYAHIAKEDAWDLLQKRMSSSAYTARLEEGEEIPGTEKFTKLVLSTRKK